MDTGRAHNPWHNKRSPVLKCHAEQGFSVRHTNYPYHPLPTLSLLSTPRLRSSVPWLPFTEVNINSTLGPWRTTRITGATPRARPIVAPTMIIDRRTTPTTKMPVWSALLHLQPHWELTSQQISTRRSTTARAMSSRGQYTTLTLETISVVPLLYLAVPQDWWKSGTFHQAGGFQAEPEPSSIPASSASSVPTAEESKRETEIVNCDSHSHIADSVGVVVQQTATRKQVVDSGYLLDDFSAISSISSPRPRRADRRAQPQRNAASPLGITTQPTEKRRRRQSWYAFRAWAFRWMWFRRVRFPGCPASRVQHTLRLHLV